VSARSRCFPILLIALAASPAAADSRLSPPDAKYLDSLMPDVLFDPTGAERVRVRTGEPDRPRFRDGWLVKGSAGRPARVYFADGYSIPAPSKLERLDFRGQAEKLFDAVQPPDTNTEQWLREMIGEIYGDDPDPFLALAAWYRRLGHDRCAAEALDLARAESDNPDQALQAHLADRALGEISRAFHVGDCATVQAAGEHYIRRYPMHSDDELDSVRALVADARRRRSQFRLGTGPALDRPPDEARLETVIARLDSVANDTCPRGGEDDPSPLIGAHRAPQTLANFGEPAVPALLAVLEQDRRLTRISFGPDIDLRAGRFVRLIAIHDLAEMALHEILGLDEFPAAAGETDEMPEPERAARRIRQYWRAYGSLSQDERMMKLLADPTVPTHVHIAACGNLGRRRGWGDESWGRSWGRRAPAVLRFHGPTAAEAILNTADREWAERAAEGSGRDWGNDEHEYLRQVVRLGDHRIAAELSRRAAASADPAVRRHYARAAADLGDTAAWTQFTRDVERGAIPLGNSIWPDTGRARRERTLQGIVVGLIDSHTAETDRALDAMTDPAHPYFPTLLAALKAPSRDPWTAHPYWLNCARRLLTDRSAAGGRYSLEGSVVNGPADQWWGVRGRPEWADRSRFLPEVAERECDEPAILLSEHVLGAPFYHPLRKDADLQLAALTAFIDKYRRRVRLATYAERSALRSRGTNVFVPDIRPLGRPAAAADVKAGAAVFHLDGKGLVWTGPVPSKVVLKAAANNRSTGLVVQAEADADGKAVFGVIFRHELRMVRADEIEP
jgi:hypothetical protein